MKRTNSYKLETNKQTKEPSRKQNLNRLITSNESESEVAQSCLTLITPWTIAHQGPLSMGFPRQEYWSGLPFPPPGDLLTQGLNPGLLHCRQILYCMRHQGNPQNKDFNIK